MARMTPEQLAARLAAAAQRIIPSVEKGMDLAALNIEARAKLNCSPGSSPYYRAPFQTGLLRAEIYHQTEVHGNAVQGFVCSPTEYAEAVHEGTSRRAGRPFILDAIVSERDATQKILAEHLSDGLEAV
jgi:hypothetical protein